MRNSIFIVLSLLCFSLGQARAQGCVAIRGMGCAGNMMVGEGLDIFAGQGEFAISAGYRHFRSFRHFRGKEEERHRLTEGTEVVNYFHSLELGLTYGINNRLSATLSLPLNHNDRSSMYEHYGNSVSANPDRMRFYTHSAGLSDVRLALSYWLIDPSRHSLGNLAIGGGIKLPTGNFRVEGDFHRRAEDGTDFTVRRPVDQSIQLGDGGWGYNLEVLGYQQISGPISLFYSGFYMATPANTNGVLRNPTADPQNVFNYFSVADQYSGRLGILFTTTSGLALSAGGRIEGIPATDLIGKSEGFRRPGYALSVEPGLSWTRGLLLLNASLPVAVARNRIKNTQDKLLERHGDAAFADYLINFSLTYLIPRSHPSKME